MTGDYTMLDKVLTTRLERYIGVGGRGNQQVLGRNAKSASRVTHIGDYQGVLELFEDMKHRQPSAKHRETHAKFRETTRESVKLARNSAKLYANQLNTCEIP